ncbi:diacylglycerol kinase family protein [Staphylococcus americanisciuri]|uniref:Diacylglycerol kinase family protein n=1 Tax=Staphylococcus americanisciuri TaxID=2973940 RepID=A0ABT2EZB1_9STAP|nr:diacylglycerol kinase family protein [Staphylococcus americanisciuri]MCS4485554.1 diacylglycerol kinase family protein [Staphylococcus americanisciuri]
MKRFTHAFEGGRTLFRKDHNFLTHILAGCMAIILGFIYHISMIEWVFVMTAIALVLLAEAINTAIEYTVDLITDEYDIKAKHAKDIAAFSVLLASVFALIIGIIIFLPKLF